MSNDQTILDAARAFAALGSEQRISVLRALVRAGPEGLTVGVLRERVGLPASTLTHHLKTLAEAGLVDQARKGREIHCAAAAYDRVEALSTFLINECCADAPDGAKHNHGAKP